MAFNTTTPAKQRKYLDVELKREKGIISVPPDMNLSEAIEWLTIKQKAEEQTVSLTETIVGFPLDACHALMLAVDQMFGFKEPKAGWTPPPFIAVPVDHKGGTVDIFVGQFRLPGIDGQFLTQPHESAALMLTGQVKQKHLKQVKELAALARKILAAQSLYRKQAFKLNMAVINGLYGEPRPLRCAVQGSHGNRAGAGGTAEVQARNVPARVY